MSLSRRRAPVPDAKRAVAYLRQSTTEQRLSPAVQRSEIERWAKSEGVEIVEWFTDEGLSGSLEMADRPGLNAAVDSLAEKGAGLLVVMRRDRLARDTLVALMVERLVERGGARVVSADGVANEEGPESALFRTILHAVAQYERALLRMRTRGAMQAKKRRGEVVGAVPFGYRAPPPVDVPIGEKRKPRPLERDPKEWAVVEQARKLHAAGLSLRAVGAELAKRGMFPRVGKTWHASAVARMVKESG